MCFRRGVEGVLKHGQGALEWFWLGWVCFRQGAEGWLKHGQGALEWFWLGWVCFRQGAKGVLKHGQGAYRWFWAGWVCFNAAAAPLPFKKAVAEVDEVDLLHGAGEGGVEPFQVFFQQLVLPEGVVDKHALPLAALGFVASNGVCVLNL